MIYDIDCLFEYDQRSSLLIINDSRQIINVSILQHENNSEAEMINQNHLTVNFYLRIEEGIYCA